MNGGEDISFWNISSPTEWSATISHSLITYESNGIISYVNGNPNVTISGEIEKEPTLFDSIEESMKGKLTSIPSLENNAMQDIRSILALIYNTFISRSNNLNCFFVNGKENNRHCFQYINSLPMYRLSLFKDGSTTVSFAADWNGDRKFYDGWDSIPENETEKNEALKKSTAFKAKSVFVISNVQVIRLFEWGFEILNGGNIELVAILSYALQDKPEHCMNLSPWLPPFKADYLKHTSFMLPIATWTKSV